MPRHRALICLIACLAGALYAAPAIAAEETAAMPEATESIYEVRVEPMKADTSTSPTLAPLRGKVLLVVNVASKCGFTPQYEGLEALHKKYKEQGLVVVGFPSNDFGGQEPGSEAEIKDFCKLNYGVTFPLYAKVHAKETPLAPIYEYLTERAPEKGPIKWNFEKFLIGRDGKVVARFRSQTKPDDPALIKAIEEQLATPAPAPVEARG